MESPAGGLRGLQAHGSRVKTRAFALLFPPQCLLCGDQVLSDGGLCGPCWRDTPFILGLTCALCGMPLPGADDGVRAVCDACHAADRPWTRGRAVMLYSGGARRLVLGLKHGDRLDLVPALARWMAARAGPLLDERSLLAPVPAHWRRLLSRRYNPAAELANALARETGRPACPDLLERTRRTPPQDGLGVDARYANLDGAIRVTKRHGARLRGSHVLLIDDVMTSGATFDTCARACLAHGAQKVSVMALARVVRDA